MNIFQDAQFLFQNDYLFENRFSGRYDWSDSFFSNDPSEVDTEYLDGDAVEHNYETNFVRDVRAMPLEDMPEAISRGEGLRQRKLFLANNTMLTFAHEYQPATYTKGHRHMGGYHVVIIGGSGYTLMWPPDAGARPWEAGKADMVVRVNYGQGTVFVPPTNWWHQHFNTGSDPVLYVPTTWGLGRRMPNGDLASLVSLRDGGDQIDYDLEDPTSGSGSPRRCGSRAASIGWSRSRSPVESAPVTTSRRARCCPGHSAWGRGRRAAGIRPHTGSGTDRGRRARVRVRLRRRRGADPGRTTPLAQAPVGARESGQAVEERPTARRVPLKTAYTTTAGTMAPLWAAKEAGIFDELGFDAELALITSGQAMLGALLSREVPLAMVGANQIVEANLQVGEYLIVGSAMPVCPNSVYVHSSIQRPGPARQTGHSAPRTTAPSPMWRSARPSSTGGSSRDAT